jgi:4-hydroxybenzoate polyprenyltransferase
LDGFAIMPAVQLTGEIGLQALVGLIKTMRPRQWTKNVLFVFPALFFDGKFFTPAFFDVLLACIFMIAMSGTVYIINDLADIEKDRQHPKKKFRPLASGQVPLPLARAAAVVIPIVALILAYAWNWKLATVMALYLLSQIAYSFRLKNVVIIDVLMVASGFVLRVIAGVVVIDVTRFSPWLYAAAGLLALFLVVAKRRQELINLGDNAINTRPIFQHYNLPLLDDMLRMVTTSTLITYILYTIEQETVIQVTGVNLTLATVPFVLYGLFHYLYLIHVKEESAPPDEVLLKDFRLQMALLLWAITYLGLIYVLPGQSQ